MSVPDIYCSYQPVIPEKLKITVRDIAILDSRKIQNEYRQHYQPIGQRYDPMSMVDGRWFSEKQISVRNLIRIKTVHHEKYNSILIVDEEIEGLVNGLSDFEIRLDDWIDHDIDPFVEYFGYIRDLKIHCFRINLHRGDDLYIRRAMSPSYPIPPDEPPIRQMYG